MAQENVLMSNPKHQHINQKNHIGYHGAPDHLQQAGKLDVPEGFHMVSQKSHLVKGKAGDDPENERVEDDQKHDETEPGKGLEEIPRYEVAQVHKCFPVNVS